MAIAHNVGIYSSCLITIASSLLPFPWLSIYHSLLSLLSPLSLLRVFKLTLRQSRLHAPTYGRVSTTWMRPSLSAEAALSSRAKAVAIRGIARELRATPSTAYAALNFLQTSSSI